MDIWFKLMLGVIPLAFAVVGVVLLFEDAGDALVMLGMAIFYVLLFRLVMPQRYQVYSDRMRIVLGGPFAWNIPFSTIREARAASGSKAFAYNGVRFATSSKGVVQITRSRGCSVVISLTNKDIFLEQLSRAMQIQTAK